MPSLSTSLDSESGISNNVVFLFVLLPPQAGLTPLHVAAFLGSAELVRVLLEHGASVEQATMRGETPLHLGARSCRPEVAELLLKHGAAVDAKAKASLSFPSPLTSHHYHRRRLCQRRPLEQ